MMKATLSCAVLLGLVLGSVPALAEVQNVRVGGDITVRAFHRENLDLNEDTSVAATSGFDNENFLMSTVGLNVAADLTENVSAFVRIVNERDWDQTIAHAAAADPNSVGLSQAYITLKELFYSPLTLTIGTQPIVWGRGFVLGSNLLPGTLLRGGDVNGSITANEFTDFTSFDAVRGTLDLAGIAGLDLPLTLDYVYIKLDENMAWIADDQNVQGVNLSTNFDAMNSEMEVYYLHLRDKSGVPTGAISTTGVRGSLQPTENSTAWGELAYQAGSRAVSLEEATTPALYPRGGGHQAWAANLGIEVGLGDVALTPKVGAEWRFYSGKDVDNARLGWRPVAPGYFTTALREFQTRDSAAGFYPNAQTEVTSGATNQHELALFGSFYPVEDLTVNQRVSWFILPVGSTETAGTPGSGNRTRFLGTEWDTVLAYDYTDDVQLGLIYGVFFPGEVFRESNDSTPQELITSVSLKF